MRKLHDNRLAPDSAGLSGWSYWQPSVLYGSVLLPVAEAACSNAYVSAQVTATTKHGLYYLGFLKLASSTSGKDTSRHELCWHFEVTGADRFA